MSLLQLAVWVVSLALVATKLFDCWSTVVHMQGPSDESNPLARAAMVRFGPRVTIWAVFALVVAIVAVVGGSAYRTAADVPTEPAVQPVKFLAVWGYIVLGLFISLAQAAVAQTNRTGRFNPISRAVLHVANWFRR